MRSTMGRQAYSSDLTDKQWEILRPLIPLPSLEGRPATVERRELVNAILYVLRSGCPWRLLPHEFPAWGTVYYYFRRWQREGVWEQILQTLRMQVRQKEGRNAEPSAAIIDSQSIKTSAVRGPEKSYDAGRKNLGTQTTPAGGSARPSPGGQSARCSAFRSGRSGGVVRAVEREL